MDFVSLSENLTGLVFIGFVLIFFGFAFYRYAISQNGKIVAMIDQSNKGMIATMQGLLDNSEKTNQWQQESFLQSLMTVENSHTQALRELSVDVSGKFKEVNLTLKVLADIQTEQQKQQAEHMTSIGNDLDTIIRNQTNSVRAKKGF